MPPSLPRKIVKFKFIKIFFVCSDCFSCKCQFRRNIKYLNKTGKSICSNIHTGISSTFLLYNIQSMGPMSACFNKVFYIIQKIFQIHTSVAATGHSLTTSNAAPTETLPKPTNISKIKRPRVQAVKPYHTIPYPPPPHHTTWESH